MKINRLIKALSMLLVVAFAACSDFEDVELTSPDKPAGNQGAFFPTSNVIAHELEPTDPTQITVTVSRAVSTGAVSLPVIVKTNDDNVFNVPATANFAEGETETDIVVTFPDAAEGITYKLVLAVEGDQSVDPYGKGAITVSTQVTRIKWTTVADPFIYRDGTFDGAGWGDNSRPMYVYAEKAQLGSSVRYRMKNVYKTATSETPDADGVYNGFYNFTPGFDSSKDWYTVIEIHSAAGTSGNVSMPKHEIGSERSTYGKISIGSKDGSFGTLSNNKITFPAGSLMFYDNDGDYNAKVTTIYLTKEAYIKDNMKIVDFNDVEYVDIVGDLGEFESLAYTETWSKTISQAINIDSTNVASEYKNLFYLEDLYSNGYGLAFYYDATSGKVTIPENQQIGRKVFGQDLYVSPSENKGSSVEINDKGVTIYTFGLTFHYKDGTIVGDFAETYYYSKDPLIYTKADFLGNFLMTGPSQFAGEAPANMEVEITEGSNANSLVITGIDYTEEVIATFNSATNSMSIAPQDLADIETATAIYTAKLHTTPPANTTGTATIDLVYNLKGLLVVSPDSEASGYLIRGTAGEAGGWFDGYRNLQFTPITAESEGNTTQSVSTFVLRSSNSIVAEREYKAKSNFFIQGKKSTDKKRVIL